MNTPPPGRRIVCVGVIPDKKSLKRFEFLTELVGVSELTQMKIREGSAGVQQIPAKTTRTVSG